MAIAAYFNPNGLTVAQFEEVHRRLGESGADARDGSLQVYEIWESPEAFQAFGATLMPILAEVGVEVGEPMVAPLYRLEQGEREIV